MVAEYIDAIRAERETRGRPLFTPDTLLNLPNHHALRSWISSGARGAAPSRRSTRTAIDEKLEHHVPAQLARGGNLPGELPHPFRATEVAK